jgi:hypothetical protein
MSLSADKTAAEQILAAVVKKARKNEAAIGVPFKACRLRRLRECLADFCRDPMTTGDDPRHAGVSPDCSPVYHPPVAR